MRSSQIKFAITSAHEIHLRKRVDSGEKQNKLTINLNEAYTIFAENIQLDHDLMIKKW